MRTSTPSCAHPPLISDRGLCAAGDARAAEAGARALQQGGTAVDAVVAAGFASFVVEQIDCGLGGFARIALLRASDGRMLSIDGYVRAPSRAHPTMFAVDPRAGATYYGHPVSCDAKSKYGPLAVAVPGAVAALCEARKQAGSLPLAQLIGPAVELASGGIDFSWRDALAVGALQQTIATLPDTAARLLPEGRLPRVTRQAVCGDRLDTTALARTLRIIGERGGEAFYDGPIGKANGDYLRAHGGIVEQQDLARYRPRVVVETPARYRQLEYVSCLDHVSYLALGLLDGFDVGALGPDSFGHRHLMAEALGCAFSDSLAHYADPECGPAPLDGLSSRAYADERRGTLSRERALDRPIVAGDPWPFSRDHAAAPGAARSATPSPATRGGTTQVIASDRHGNIAALCTAIGWDYGSLVYCPETGIFFNNGMHYFDPRPNRPASIEPGKQPMFGAPVIVAGERGRARFTAAGSGGYRIASAVLHTLVNHVDHRMDVARAVDHPRVHCQGRETFVDARIERQLCEQLEAAGHRVVTCTEDPSTWHFGRVCALTIDEDGVTARASAGPHYLTAIAAP